MHETHQHNVWAKFRDFRIHVGDTYTKMDLQEVGYGGMDWIDLAQDRDRWPALVNAVMNLRVP